MDVHMNFVDDDSCMHKAHRLTEDTFYKICELQKKMYVVDHSKLSKITSSFLTHLKDFYDELVNSCSEKFNDLNQSAENKQKEILIFQKELKITEDLLIDEEEPLCSKIKKFDEIIGELKNIKSFRMEKLQNLLEKENELCLVIGAPRFPSFAGIPTEEELTNFETHISGLQAEKMKRIRTYRDTKQSIVGLITQLEYECDLPFHKEIINSTEETYILTLEYLDRTKDFEAKLKYELEEAKKNMYYLKEKLIKLWERIKTEDDWKEQFLNKIKGVGKSFQKQMSEELERCEEIKKANMKPVIESIRTEISNMWDKLTYASQQRKEFISFFVDTYTDEVFTLHELQLNKLTTIYEENKHIFELAAKRESLWERMLHLDQVAMNKDRFKNRGGQLLKEEKERKILENSVPRTDAQLKNFLNEFKEKTGNIFLWHGEDLLTKINNDWTNRLLSKDNKKFNKPETTKNKNRNDHDQPAAKKRCLVAITGDLNTEPTTANSVPEHLGTGGYKMTESRKRNVLKDINSPMLGNNSPLPSANKTKTPVKSSPAYSSRLVMPKNWH